MKEHRTETGHIPAVAAASWACTCGQAEVRDYGPSFPPEAAVQLMDIRAIRHRTDALIRDLETEQK